MSTRVVIGLSVMFAAGVGLGILSRHEAPAASRVVETAPMAERAGPLTTTDAPSSSLYPEIREADKASFAGLLSRFRETGDDLAVDLVLARWAERNPSGAVDDILQQEGSDSETLTAFFSIWAEFDLDRALAKIASLAKTGAYGDCTRWREAAFASAARIDPQGALDRGLDLFHHSPPWTEVALRRLARSDPQLAATFLPRFQGWGAKMQPASDIARFWLAKDPERAFEWARGLDEGVGSYARRMILESLHENPELAGDWFVSLTGPEQDSQAVGALDTIASRFARRDPIAAYDWAMKVIPAEHLANTLREAIAPNIPAGQVNAFLDRFASDDVYDALARELAEDRTVSEHTLLVESLLKRTERAESEEGLEGLLFNTIAKWSFQEPQSLADWAMDFKGSVSVRDMALTQSLSANRNSIDLEGAFAIYEEIHEVSASAANALEAIWAVSDPRGGLEWAQSLDEAMQAQTIEGIVSTWVRHEPQAASQHINSLPVGGARDTAVATLIESSYRSAPAVSFEWATSLSNPQTLESSMRQILPFWAERDLEACTNAIAQAGFDDQTAMQFLTIARESITSANP